ncbi:MAG: hypothetical protein FWG94_12720 [Oscillospiraceae bacterium]|nr:hypothetical protein [Oscillospiraceae bacterium]
MNREQRRKTGKLRGTALALLVAGTLASGAVTDLYAVASDPGGDLIIQGGGGGGGGGIAGCGGVTNDGGGGGGAYIEYSESGNIIAWQFSGGGQGYEVEFSPDSGYGIISGGGGKGNPFPGLPGGTGGRSGTSPGGDPNSDGVGNGTVSSHDSDSDIGAKPSWLSFPAIGNGAGSDGKASGNGGAGGSAAVSLTQDVRLNNLTLISGEAGSDSYAPGGAGGSASFSTTGKLDAQTIELYQDYAGYTNPAGYVSLSADTLVVRDQYSIHMVGTPGVTVGGLEFDLTGVAKNNVSAMLDVTGGDLNLDGVGDRIAFMNVPDGAGAGDVFYLINNVIQFTDLVLIESGGHTFNVYMEDFKLYAQYLGQGGNGGGGGSGGISGSGGGSSGGGITPPPPTTCSVTQAAANAATQNAIAAAKAEGSTKATAKFRNACKISLSTLKAMANAAKQAGMESLRLQADSMNENSVDVRITVDPEKSTQDLYLSASTSNSQVTRTTNTFAKFFSNDIMTVSLGQEGTFGQDVRIAAKLNPKLNTDNLVFYTYDRETNTYRRILEPNYRIDANGYVHFDTVLAGDIIISDGVLAKR